MDIGVIAIIIVGIMFFIASLFCFIGLIQLSHINKSCYHPLPHPPNKENK